MVSRIMLSALLLVCVWNYASGNSVEPPPINDGDRCPVKQLRGEKGDPGPVGPAGKDGLPGKQGDKGDKGEQGIKGDNGMNGGDGPKGAKGIPGDDGKEGSQGPKGDKGEEGKCDAQCGDIKKLEARLQSLESNYTQELVGIKQKLDFLMTWIHPLGSKENPAVSCKDILKRDRTAPSGPYYIEVSGTNLPGNAQEVYCIMRRSYDCPAGVTQVLKIDGRKNTFKYSSPLWTDKNMYMPTNGRTGCDYTQTKLATYWSTPFESICVRMRRPNTWRIRSRKIDIKGKSLYDLIAPGKYIKTNLDIKNGWKDLLYPYPSSLQRKCTKQGFNVYTQASAVRIGILGDEWAGCPNPDSYIGFGTEGSSCGRNPTTSCGNEAGCGGDQGDRHTQTMGYIYVY